MRDRLLVPDPVLDRGHRPLREGVRGGRDRRLGVHRLGRDDPEATSRKLRGIRGGAHGPGDLACPRQPQAVSIDRLDVRAIEVEGPDLDVVELREVRREERAHCSASDDADLHE
jgi:hypothetical protein